ncbi:MAG: hypothetical protein WCP55_11365 [Lentisphaerota bacterium]
MGRPLKIQQYNTAQAVAIDQGYPQFANLDPTTAVVPSGMTTTQYLGVTGGGYNGGIASTTFPIVQIRANVNGTAGNAYIITQKGASKYLVAATNTVNDGSFVAGNSYIIKTLGNTAWSTIGGIVSPAVGEVFTAITTGSSANTGTASDVGQCAMVANATITAGQMSISFNSNGNAIYASRLTNKYIFDGSTPPNRYAVNFFVAGEGSAVTLSNVAIANTAGAFTSNVANITTGQLVTVSGTNAGTGTISGYANPTNYFVIATTNGNAFTLSSTTGGANIVTTAGSTTNLVFTLATSTTVKSGAEPATWTNATGNITLAQVNKYTA